MITSINQYGVMQITAENSIELFALKKWAEGATVKVNDLARCETQYWQGSKLILDCVSELEKK